MIEGNSSQVINQHPLVNYEQRLKLEHTQKLESTQIEFATNSTRYAELHDRVFPHLSFNPDYSRMDHSSPAANTEFAEENDPEASRLKSALTELIEAKLKLEKSKFRLMQAERKYAESLVPTVQLQIATLERALAEIKGERHKNIKSPDELSNLQVVFNWLTQGEQDQIHRDHNFFRDAHKLGMIERVKDSVDDLRYSTGLKQKLTNFFSGLGGQGTRGQSSKKSLEMLSQYTQRREDNLSAIVHQFASHSESWYMPTTKSISETN